MIKNDHHEGYIIAILIWPKWPKWPKTVGPLSLPNPEGLGWCGRPKGLIFFWRLILPRSREFAEVRAPPYFLNTYRPCSARAITLVPFPNFLSRKAAFLISRSISSFQRYYKFADKVFSLYSLIMRPCAVCRRVDTICLVSDESDSYEQYFRHNRFYDLAFLTYE
jgi:hypothetical protein